MLINIVDYLTDGYWQQQGQARRTFKVQPGETLTANLATLTPEGQQLATWALESWSEVTGITIQLVNHTNADLTFDDNEEGAFSFHTLTGDGSIVSAHVNVSTDWLYQYGTGIDSYSFQTYLHEIGHALGLGHPGPYNGDFPNFLTETVSFYDSWHTTVMSYIDQSKNIFQPGSYAHVVTPMMADIMAVHELYGEPAGVNTGNTTYGYNSNTGTYLDEFFRLWTGEGNPFVSINLADIRQPEFIHLDNDGDIDMVTLNRNRDTFYVYENTGTSSAPLFSYSESIYWGNIIQDYAFIDSDGDNDLDIVIADNTGIYLVENSPGNPAPVLMVAGAYSGKIEFADMDGDGDLDIIETHENQVFYTENIGTVTSHMLAETEQVFTLDHQVHDFKLVDENADGDYDFVAVDPLGSIYLYENTGTSSTPVFNPDEYSYYGNPLDSSRYGALPAAVVRDLTFSDLDNDNDLDFIAIDNYNSVQYFENIGTASEFYFVPTNFNRTTTFTLYDTDGVDLLDVRTDIYPQWIDLNPVTESSVYGLVNNLIIAHNTVIENVVAGRNNDIVFGNPANNVINGFYGDDQLFGNNGNDTLKGHAGDDLLRGDKGNDRLMGGPGADTLVGGLGDDIFIIGPADGVYDDQIIDFHNGKNVIDLSGFDTIQSLDDFEYYKTPSGVDGYIDLTPQGGGRIFLKGFTDDLYDYNFILAETTGVVG